MANKNKKILSVVVDDTALVHNIEEIEQWVQNGVVQLVLPLYTLERLHTLKKDSGAIGLQARKAVKFLDQASSIDSFGHDPVAIQGPDDQFATWTEVEAMYADGEHVKETVSVPSRNEAKKESEIKDELKLRETTPEISVANLSIASVGSPPSALSTPPLSPTVTETPSSVPVPAVRVAAVSKHEAMPVPPALTPLVNFVVWYLTRQLSAEATLIRMFLTNSDDTARIARDFGIVPKTIHQLRASIMADFDISLPTPASTKQDKRSSTSLDLKNEDDEPKTLFRYDESEEEEDEVVFQPRNASHNQPRPQSAGRMGPNQQRSGRGAFHSPANSMNVNVTPVKPQIPVEEIDPDSFDRGTFGRGSTPLANVGNGTGNFVGQQNGWSNGRANFRGGQNNGYSRGGYAGFRGQNGGFRGNNRGRGRLFVP